jgi:hypothetical protein
MPYVEITNMEFGPLQITLRSSDNRLRTLVLGRRKSVVVDEDNLTEDVHRKAGKKPARIKIKPHPGPE